MLKEGIVMDDDHDGRLTRRGESAGVSDPAIVVRPSAERAPGCVDVLHVFCGDASFTDNSVLVL